MWHSVHVLIHSSQIFFVILTFAFYNEAMFLFHISDEHEHESGMYRKNALKIALNAWDHYKQINTFFSYPMLRYLRTDHIQHCVPSIVSSGLATLPLSFVYVNNTAIKSRPTNKSLPTGELLNGKKSYQQIVSYFTTNTMTPDEIHDLGFKMLKELYPQVSDLDTQICDHEL